MKSLKIDILSALIFILFLSGASCTNDRRNMPEADNMMSDAGLIRVEQHEGFRVAYILNSKDSTVVDATFVLVDKNSALPDSLPSGTLIRTPLDNIVAFSSVLAGALEELGKVDIVKGVVDASYFSQDAIKEGLNSGSIVDLGASSGPSLEKIAALQPEAILLNYYDGMDVKGIDKSGVPLIGMTDNLERDPVARAEWIRFIGMLTGAEEKADSIFRSVKKSYTRLKDMASSFPRRPKILTENMYQGVWYVPGGESYQARIISDAGGEYLWKDDKSTGSIGLSFEEVISKGKAADIWLLKLYGVTLDKNTLLSMDSRYRFFDTVDKGGVFYSDTSVSPLFEEFPYHPDRLLRDYILIFHPEAKNLGSMRYFKPMDQ